MQFLVDLFKSSNVQATITALILEALVLAIPALAEYREALVGIVGVLYALVISLLTIRETAALRATGMTFAQAQGRQNATPAVPQGGFDR